MAPPSCDAGYARALISAAEVHGLRSRAVYYTFAAGMTFPIFLALVPLFFVVQGLGLLNTYAGLILVYTAYALPFTVFFLTTFFRNLPWSVAEAGIVDGCSHYGVFFRVMLPMARPGLISIGIFNFLGLWNQYLLPLALNQEPERSTPCCPTCPRRWRRSRNR